MQVLHSLVRGETGVIVVLSTFNGAARLGAMLEALLSVRLPAGTEIHVADNGSDDATLAMLRQYQDRLPLVLYECPVRGKNHGLNHVLDRAAARVAPDDLVVLTDDDILPSEGWLEALAEAATAHTDCDVFAGRILPHWPNAGIAHLEALRPYFDVLYSVTTASEGPVACTGAWGPNMAVRAKIFQTGIRFDPNFGPDGTSNYPMGSETELMERLDAAGHRAWFAEGASVRHIIRPNQIGSQSIVQRAFRHGYGAGCRLQRGKGLWTLAQLLAAAARAMALARLRHTFGEPSDWLLNEYREAWGLGLLRGALFAMRRGSESPTPRRPVPASRAAGEVRVEP
jgi:Glycosyltransferase like family 2